MQIEKGDQVIATSGQQRFRGTVLDLARGIGFGIYKVEYDVRGNKTWALFTDVKPITEENK